MRITEDIDAIATRLNIVLSNQEGQLEMDAYRFIAITRQITDHIRLRIELHVDEHESK